jgi:hypothetical protein
MLRDKSAQGPIVLRDPIDWLIDLFIDCPSRPIIGSYAACDYKYRCPPPLLSESKAFLVRMTSPSAPVSYIPTRGLVNRSVPMYLSDLSWPSSTSIYQASLVFAMCIWVPWMALPIVLRCLDRRMLTWFHITWALKFWVDNAKSWSSALIKCGFCLLRKCRICAFRSSINYKLLVINSNIEGRHWNHAWY